MITTTLTRTWCGMALMIVLTALFIGCHQAPNGTHPTAKSGVPPLSVASPLKANAGETQKQLQEANDHFTYQGKPISPGVLKDFALDDLSGDVLPAGAVLLEKATDEQYEIKSEGTDIRKGINASYGERTPLGQESIGYSYLGRLANGTHVLRAYYSGGGTGVFMVLILINFATQQYITDEGMTERVLMMDAGQMRLGDRYDGKITIEPKRITIGPGRNHEEQQVIQIN